MNLFICSFALLLLLNWCQPASAVQPPPTNAFELREGDRVVFLGNAFFENENRYGLIELALTTRWPDRNLTFRNLGWSGDTVFGESRIFFTSPPTAFELLLDQVGRAQPSVIFIAYGAVESMEGEKGVERFREGYHALLDSLSATDARFVLLSPTPRFATPHPFPDAALINQNLKRYSDVIASIARERALPFVNLLEPLSAHPGASLSTNGIHLTEAGYRFAAEIIEQQLSPYPHNWNIVFDFARRQVQADGATVSNLSVDGGMARFTLLEPRLMMRDARRIALDGLPAGSYALMLDDRTVLTASSEEWKAGRDLPQDFCQQTEALRAAIVAKNELFFHQYRPQNRTYILGFRHGEQGRNVTELQALDELIEEKEREIAGLRVPRTQEYQLVPIISGERGR